MAAKPTPLTPLEAQRLALAADRIFEEWALRRPIEHGWRPHHVAALRRGLRKLWAIAENGEGAGHGAAT